MTIREARAGDLEAVARVAQRSGLLLDPRDEQTFPQMLQWLYAESPVDLRLQLVAERDEAVVAHYGGVPFLYRVNGRTCVGAFASNLVIDVDHRAGMLFLSLQSHLQREYAKRGFAFAYGLITRPAVLAPHLRTGWTTIGLLPVYAKPFRFPRVAASYIPSPALRAAAYVPLKLAEVAWRGAWLRPARGVSVEHVAAFAADADAFLEAFGRVHDIAAVRTREILNWRFTGFAERDYRIALARRDGRVCGFAVTRRMQLKQLDALALVDIAFDPGDGATAEALLRDVDAQARRRGVDVTATIATPGRALWKRLRAWGYLRTPESFSLVAHEARNAAHMLSPAMFERWHITWFDHDYV